MFLCDLILNSQPLTWMSFLQIWVNQLFSQFHLPKKISPGACWPARTWTAAIWQLLYSCHAEDSCHPAMGIPFSSFLCGSPIPCIPGLPLSCGEHIQVNTEFQAGNNFPSEFWIPVLLPPIFQYLLSSEVQRHFVSRSFLTLWKSVGKFLGSHAPNFTVMFLGVALFSSMMPDTVGSFKQTCH